jgi:hypothetical protein
VEPDAHPAIQVALASGDAVTCEHRESKAAHGNGGDFAFWCVAGARPVLELDPIVAGAGVEAVEPATTTRQPSKDPNLGDQLRDAVMKGNTDAMMGLFKQCEPPADPAEQVAELFKQHHVKAVVPASPLSAVASSILQRPQEAETAAHVDASCAFSDLLPQVPPSTAHFESPKKRPTAANTLGATPPFSPEHLDSIDAQHLAQMHDMVTQALQRRASAGMSPAQRRASAQLSPAAPDLSPLPANGSRGAKPKSAFEDFINEDMLSSACEETAAASPFGDLIEALTSKNMLAGN